jgi:glutamine amidotransferase PdxT
MRQVSLFFVIILALPLTAAAATDYYVDNTNPGANDSNSGSISQPWRTIGKCASTIVAGDTCVVGPGGVYNERVTETTSGTSANFITYRKATGGAAPVVRGFSLNVSYVKIDGLEFTHASPINSTENTATISLGSNASNIHLFNLNIHDTNFQPISSNSTATSGKIWIKDNTITRCGTNNSGAADDGIEVYGADLLIEGNTIQHCTDIIRGAGARNIIRNNVFCCVTATEDNNQHTDGYQHFEGPEPDHFLWENNKTYNFPHDDTHGIFINSVFDTSPPFIVRHSVFADIDGNGLVRDGVDEWHVYNNTIADCSCTNGAIQLDLGTGGSVRNNIFYNATSGSSPYTADGSLHDYNMAYRTSGGTSWSGDFNGEANKIANVNPNFTNPAGYDYTLQAGSAAINSGGHLTTVAAADSGSGTSLVVSDSRFFQDGWGNPNVQADWIAVGSVSNTVQITSINYATQTITLASSISRSSGDRVWLYKDSDGTIVLEGSAPDRGAFEFGSGSGTTATSTAISSSAGTVTYGTSQTFTATVTASGAPVSSGTVTFVDTTTGVTLAGNVALNGSGQAETSAILPPGSHNIQATYSGDSTYAGSMGTTAVTVTPVADSTPPTVSISAPAAGATVSGSTTVSATAADNIGVVGVQFKLDGVNLGAEDFTSPYSVSWNTTTASNGTHTLTAVARDAGGNQTTSADVTITVNNAGTGDTTPPAVSITGPAGGATVSGTVTLTATATDNVGVAGVQFKLDGVNVGTEDTSSPYSRTWNAATASNGTHTLTAVARDAAGNQTTSAAVTVTVSNAGTGDTTPPAVSITAPAAGATVSGNVTLSATATDNVGVAGVQFQLDGVDVGEEENTLPYLITWDTTTASNGTHTLTAVARDAAGNQTTSAAVTVTINNAGTSDTTPPAVSVTSPAVGATVSDTVTVTATASDNIGVAGVQFQLDGANLGSEDLSSPYSISWDTATASNGTHVLTAIARDAAGNQTTSVPVLITTSNTAPAPTPEGSMSFAIPADGGQAWVTTNSASSISANHGRFQASASDSYLSGLALIRYQTGGVLVSEAALPASAPVSSGRIFAEVNGPTNTGVAFSNPNAQSAVISFYFTDSNGNNYGNGSFTLGPNSQESSFLNEPPFNGPWLMLGTFTFNSSLPVGVIAVHSFTNERGEFLMTALPVSDITATSSNAIVLPHFVDGGGWTTQVVLTNSSDSPISGIVQFYGPGASGQSGPLLTMTADGTTGSTFPYLVQSRSAVRLVTSNASPTLQVGSVRIYPSGTAPNAAAIFKFKRNDITVSEAGVTGVPAGSEFRMYAEASGVDGQAGFIETGLAVANPSMIPVNVTLELTHMTGVAVGTPVTITVPGNGQVAKFISQLFPGLPEPFRGFLKVTSTSPVNVTGVLCRYNERLDFLFTTTPPRDENLVSPASQMLFPHIVSGGGFTTQFVIFGESGSGTISFNSPEGSAGVLSPLEPLP